jgi:5-methylthioadenosine/S-adenosylhomocysteine deaminase
LVRARTGRDNVAYLHELGFCGPDVLLAHGVWMTAEERALVARDGTRIVHCPSSNLKLASGIAPIDTMLAEGIEVALGADGAPCGNNLDGFLEMRLAALLHKPHGGPTVVPARQALRMATRGGALAMGRTDCGHIVVGARADIILLDLHKPHLYPAMGDLASRLVYAAQRSDVHTVVCDGQVVVAEGKLLTGSVTDIMAEAQAAATVLSGLLPGAKPPR